MLEDRKYNHRGGRFETMPEGEKEYMIVDNDTPSRSDKSAVMSQEDKKWFGDSKVVDKIGNPLVVYHGTDKNFEEFKNEYLGMSHGTAPSNMKGFYFTNDENSARTYGKNIKPAFLKIEKPLVLDAKGKSYSEFKHILNEKIDNINKNKYDGIIVKNYKDAGKYGKETIQSDQYIPLSTTQIKTIKNDNLSGDKREIMSGEPKSVPSGDNPYVIKNSQGEEFKIEKIHPTDAEKLVALNELLKEKQGDKTSVTSSENFKDELSKIIDGRYSAGGFSEKDGIHVVWGKNKEYKDWEKIRVFDENENNGDYEIKEFSPNDKGMKDAIEYVKKLKNKTKSQGDKREITSQKNRG